MKNFNNIICKSNLILVIAFVLTSLMSMYFSNALSNKGQDLSDIEDQVNSLQEENDFLKAKIYTLSSFNNINNRAAQEGYAKGTMDYYNPPEFASSR